VASIGEDLFGNLLFQDAQALPQPGLAIEVRPRKDQSLGIGKKVICKQVVFDGLGKVLRLRREAFFVERQPGLDPVDDSQRERIRLPPVPVTGLVFADPFPHEMGLGVLEVVQIVKPELGDARVVPRLDLPDLVEKPESPRARSWILPLDNWHPMSRRFADANTRRTASRSPPIDPAVDLNRLQMADGVKERRGGHGIAATTTVLAPPRNGGATVRERWYQGLPADR